MYSDHEIERLGEEFRYHLVHEQTGASFEAFLELPEHARDLLISCARTAGTCPPLPEHHAIRQRLAEEEAELELALGPSGAENRNRTRFQRLRHHRHQRRSRRGNVRASARRVS